MVIKSHISSQEEEARRVRKELVEMGFQPWIEYDPYDRVFWLFWNVEGAAQ